jgi:hypothetical protein
LLHSSATSNEGGSDGRVEVRMKDRRSLLSG